MHNKNSQKKKSTAKVNKNNPPKKKSIIANYGGHVYINAGPTGLAIDEELNRQNKKLINEIVEDIKSNNKSL